MKFQAIVPIVVLLAALCACNKDELTVVSTAITPVCQKVTVELDIDSLANCPPGPWNSPDVRITLCACDTLALVPVNIPSGYMFERWVIDLGPDNVDYFHPVLDTITTSSELWIDFDVSGPSPDEHFRVEVRLENCE